MVAQLRSFPDETKPKEDRRRRWLSWLWFCLGIMVLVGFGFPAIMIFILGPCPKGDTSVPMALIWLPMKLGEGLGIRSGDGCVTLVVGSALAYGFPLGVLAKICAYLFRTKE
jgi:hypothetical protein